MTLGYDLTPRARDGLFRILDYVVFTFGERVAHDVLARLERAFTMLAEHPRLGHTRHDLTDDDEIRFWSVGPTLIAYRQKLGLIEILFVERGERDWRSLLDS